MMELLQHFKKSKAIANKSAREKEIDTSQEKAIYTAVKAFERDRNTEIKKTLTLMRLMLVASVFTSITFAISVAFMSPLKSVEPFLLRVDNTTGYVDTIKPFSQQGDTYDETISRYFLTRFVENREGYEWYTVQNMFDAVELMSSLAVLQEYKNMMYGDFSPLSKLKKNNKILVRVKSVTFLDSYTAQVRFIKAIVDNDGKPTTGYSPTNWIATIAFKYNKKKVETELQRQINPLGLDVLSYKIDPEVSKS